GGTHRISAHFFNDFEDPSAEDPRRRDRNLVIDSFEIDGPVDPRPEDYPAAHHGIVTTRPEKGRAWLAAAQANLRPLMLQTIRRRPTEDEVNRFGSLVDGGVKQGDSFEQGMQAGLTAVLVSPHFLFRAEGQSKAGDPSGIRALGDYEVASRLSYFLWSSMP